MATLNLDLDDPRLAPMRNVTGPVTAARQRRTWIIYLSLFALGLLPQLMGSSPALKAAGLGLWMPGAGFLATGGWWALLFPLTLLLFVVSLVAWFWAGMVLAPILVWGGAALLAAALTGDASWAGAPYVAALATAAIGGAFTFVNARNRARGRIRAAEREAFLPQSLAEVSAMARAIPDPATRDMTPDQVAGLRYLLDRALQPVDSFDGFTIIDQFQPAALRYQINHMGFALGIAQTAYLSNFRGYMGQAQRNLIEKYLDKRVWDYWVLESCWGHLNFTNWDPAAKDNIMLTGWFGAHVGLYMIATGDRRYLEPGSLTFRLNDTTAWRHDYTTLVKSVVDNYAGAEFGHYACEPNWIYPICNHYGMLSLVTHDRLLGTGHVDRYLGRWFEKLDTEFTDAAGSIIGLRSQHTGMPVPFPVPEAGYAFFENCFAPARARKLWAVGRRDVEPLIEDSPNGARLRFPGEGLDAGNYRTGHVGSYATHLVSAREFGDARLAEAAFNGMEADGMPSREGGVLRYLKASNIANATAILGQLMDTGDFRRAFTEGPSPQTLAGPMIETMDYPAVLVARAYSGDGLSLEAVFYPGAAPGRHSIPVSQLRPGRRYRIEVAEDAELVADANGRGSFHVLLAGRTEVRLAPAD